MAMEIRNAVIRETFLGIEHHAIFTFSIQLDYGSAVQLFGNYPLDDYDKERGMRIGSAFGSELLRSVIDCFEVDSWEKLPLKPCRARIENGVIHSIGHYIKERWFDPRQIAREMGLKT